MANLMEPDDDPLLAAEPGIDLIPNNPAVHTAREKRLITGFEEIVQFYQTRQRIPRHGGEHDIFERLLAQRLAQLRQLPEAQTSLAPLDMAGILAGTALCAESLALDNLNDGALLAELGEVATGDTDDIHVLCHVRSHAERTRIVGDVADRAPCADFARFAPLLEQTARELKAGLCKTTRFRRDTSIEAGNWFIVSGQLAYVAEIGEDFTPLPMAKKMPAYG